MRSAAGNGGQASHAVTWSSLFDVETGDELRAAAANALAADAATGCDRDSQGIVFFDTTEIGCDLAYMTVSS